jgi:sirohydrochlorin ferrochelatase
MICLLFDNGSLRPAATFSLRRTAAALARRLPVPVHAVSLLHSSAIDAADLDGEPARLLEPALGEALAAGELTLLLLPLFFGPSAALTEYVPRRIEAMAARHGPADIRLARPLVDPAAGGDTRIAQALAERVRWTLQDHELRRPRVVLVDHGSPQPAVAVVRNHLAAQLASIVGGETEAVAPASMERRPGEAYAFNDPLLEDRLTTAPFNEGDVVVALQFLAPGRHAGPGGDIAQICARAHERCVGLRTYLTEPLEDDPRIVDVLVDRYREVAGR